MWWILLSIVEFLAIGLLFGLLICKVASYRGTNEFKGFIIQTICWMGMIGFMALFALVGISVSPKGTHLAQAYLGIMTLALLMPNSDIMFRRNETTQGGDELIGWARRWPWQKWSFGKNWNKREISTGILNANAFVEGVVWRPLSSSTCSAQVRVEAREDCSFTRFNTLVGRAFRRMNWMLMSVNCPEAAEELYHLEWRHMPEINVIVSDVSFTVKVEEGHPPVPNPVQVAG